MVMPKLLIHLEIPGRKDMVRLGNTHRATTHRNTPQTMDSFRPTGGMPAVSLLISRSAKGLISGFSRNRNRTSIRMNTKIPTGMQAPI